MKNAQWSGRREGSHLPAPTDPGVTVIADPAGRLIWASAALPGSTHNLIAARTHCITAR
jgi:hypothetical protein